MMVRVCIAVIFTLTVTHGRSQTCLLWPSDAVEHEHDMVWAWVPGSLTQSNMNVIMVWEWMLWSSDAVEHEHYCGLGMAAQHDGGARVYTRGCRLAEYHSTARTFG